MTPRAERSLVVLSWCLAGFAALAAGYGLFAWSGRQRRVVRQGSALACLVAAAAGALPFLLLK